MNITNIYLLNVLIVVLVLSVAAGIRVPTTWDENGRDGYDRDNYDHEDFKYGNVDRQPGKTFSHYYNFHEHNDNDRHHTDVKVEHRPVKIIKHVHNRPLKKIKAAKIYKIKKPVVRNAVKNSQYHLPLYPPLSVKVLQTKPRNEYIVKKPTQVFYKTYPAVQPILYHRQVHNTQSNWIPIKSNNNFAYRTIHPSHYKDNYSAAPQSYAHFNQQPDVNLFNTENTNNYNGNYDETIKYHDYGPSGDLLSKNLKDDTHDDTENKKIEETINNNYSEQDILPDFVNKIYENDPFRRNGEKVLDDKQFESTDIKMNQQQEEEETPELPSKDQIEKDPISEHEIPLDIPTKPIYPGEGQWARRGRKHRVFIRPESKIKATEEEESEKIPDGYETFERGQENFNRAKSNFQHDIETFPEKHKLPHIHSEYDPGKQSEPLYKKPEIGFVPIKTYAQTRKIETTRHLPRSEAFKDAVTDEELLNAARLREVIKDTRAHTVYTEEGYEDSAYDHAGHEKKAENQEGFSQKEGGQDHHKELLKHRKKNRHHDEGGNESGEDVESRNYSDDIKEENEEHDDSEEYENDEAGSKKSGRTYSYKKRDPKVKGQASIKNYQKVKHPNLINKTPKKSIGWAKTRVMKETQQRVIKNMNDGNVNTEINGKVEMTYTPDGEQVKKVKYVKKPQISKSKFNKNDKDVHLNKEKNSSVNKTNDLHTKNNSLSNITDKGDFKNITTVKPATEPQHKIIDETLITNTQPSIELEDPESHSIRGSKFKDISKSFNQVLVDTSHFDSSSEPNPIEKIEEKYAQVEAPVLNSETKPINHRVKRYDKEKLSKIYIRRRPNYYWDKNKKDYHLTTTSKPPVQNKKGISPETFSTNQKKISENYDQIGTKRLRVPFRKREKRSTFGSINRNKRYQNDFPNLDINQLKYEIIDINKLADPTPRPDLTFIKYPYYKMRNSKLVHAHSPLKYAESMDNIPKKTEGGMEFYESTASIQCPEVDSDIDPIPERIKNKQANEEGDEEESEEDKVPELVKGPRLTGLGDKIDCMKVKYFGEEPLDSPFFKEEYVEAPSIEMVFGNKFRKFKHDQNNEPSSILNKRLSKESIINLPKLEILNKNERDQQPEQTEEVNRERNISKNENQPIVQTSEDKVEESKNVKRSVDELQNKKIDNLKLLVDYLNNKYDKGHHSRIKREIVEKNENVSKNSTEDGHKMNSTNSEIKILETKSYEQTKESAGLESKISDIVLNLSKNDSNSNSTKELDEIFSTTEKTVNISSNITQQNITEDTQKNSTNDKDDITIIIETNENSVADIPLQLPLVGNSDYGQIFDINKYWPKLNPPSNYFKFDFEQKPKIPKETKTSTTEQYNVLTDVIKNIQSSNKISEEVSITTEHPTKPEIITERSENKIKIKIPYKKRRMRMKVNGTVITTEPPSKEEISVRIKNIDYSTTTNPKNESESTEANDSVEDNEKSETNNEFVTDSDEKPGFKHPGTFKTIFVKDSSEKYRDLFKPDAQYTKTKITVTGNGSPKSLRDQIHKSKFEPSPQYISSYSYPENYNRYPENYNTISNKYQPDDVQYDLVYNYDQKSYILKPIRYEPHPISENGFRPMLPKIITGFKPMLNQPQRPKHETVVLKGIKPIKQHDSKIFKLVIPRASIPHLHRVVRPVNRKPILHVYRLAVPPPSNPIRGHSVPYYKNNNGNSYYQNNYDQIEGMLPPPQQENTIDYSEYRPVTFDADAVEDSLALENSNHVVKRSSDDEMESDAIKDTESSTREKNKYEGKYTEIDRNNRQAKEFKNNDEKDQNDKYIDIARRGRGGHIPDEEKESARQQENEQRSESSIRRIQENVKPENARFIGSSTEQKSIQTRPNVRRRQDVLTDSYGNVIKEKNLHELMRSVKAPVKNETEINVDVRRGEPRYLQSRSKPKENETVEQSTTQSTSSTTETGPARKFKHNSPSSSDFSDLAVFKIIETPSLFDITEYIPISMESEKDKEDSSSDDKVAPRHNFSSRYSSSDSKLPLPTERTLRKPVLLVIEEQIAKSDIRKSTTTSIPPETIKPRTQKSRSLIRTSTEREDQKLNRKARERQILAKNARQSVKYSDTEKNNRETVTKAYLFPRRWSTTTSKPQLHESTTESLSRKLIRNNRERANIRRNVEVSRPANDNIDSGSETETVREEQKNNRSSTPVKYNKTFDTRHKINKDIKYIEDFAKIGFFEFTTAPAVLTSTEKVKVNVEESTVKVDEVNKQGNIKTSEHNTEINKESTVKKKVQPRIESVKYRTKITQETSTKVYKPDDEEIEEENDNLEQEHERDLKEEELKNNKDAEEDSSKEKIKEGNKNESVHDMQEEEAIASEHLEQVELIGGITFEQIRRGPKHGGNYKHINDQKSDETQGKHEDDEDYDETSDVEEEEEKSEYGTSNGKYNTERTYEDKHIDFSKQTEPRTGFNENYRKGLRKLPETGSFFRDRNLAKHVNNLRTPRLSKPPTEDLSDATSKYIQIEKKPEAGTGFWSKIIKDPSMRQYYYSRV